MAETEQKGGDKPEAPSTSADQAAEPKGVASAAAKADHQDKTKDKPDSGQNEDG